MALAAVMVFSPGIAAAGSMTLKVSHQFAAGDVRDQMARVFGDKITEKTNGEIKFRYYPAKSLYKPKEQWDALRKGALDMSVFPLDYASGKVPQLPAVAPWAAQTWMGSVVFTVTSRTTHLTS